MSVFDAIGNVVGQTAQQLKLPNMHGMDPNIQQLARHIENWGNSLNVGNVGMYEAGELTITPVEGEPVSSASITWTPTGSRLMLTTFRIWTEASETSTWELACVLDGYSTGRDRGYISGGPRAALDAGLTAKDVEAIALIEWTTADTPGPTDFLYEIISAPIA